MPNTDILTLRPDITQTSHYLHCPIKAIYYSGPPTEMHCYSDSPTEDQLF